MSIFRSCGTTLFLIVFGLIFVAVGAGISIFGSRAAATAADRAEQMEPLTPGSLEMRAIGSEVLIEGQLSSRNNRLFREYVAYIREEYRGSDDDGDPEWVEDERRTPPLLIEVGGVRTAPVQIGNDDYVLKRTHESWQESNRLTWNGLSGEGTKRYSGLIAGRAVMAIGTVQRGLEGLELQAEFIFGGTRAEYIADQRSAATWLPWFGLAFVVPGVAIAGFGVLQLLRSVS